ncbi:hypothetical protein [Moritella viscosa]|uniref:PilZ domain-containing protein n=1 Tax=Moritella viscosa TaxID=80854 RepID=A0A090IFE5_9GAMM|nr:hypothetical protein [Moritella viscosa]CED59557.1 putative uncharacterized protein [Moritella viscosa]SGY86895.1 Putative uncharacterized protein [Moritella viscosa]SGY88445.1 Putative uncharacterized protein [Moritella viscosa]SGY88574.1 Putative uncharacterized protein [Moritella viscosa]SGY90458.1 Putative uncharacterized protein [Moritella viscosa]
MFSVKKDLSLKINREHSRFNYGGQFPILYVNKLGLFDFFKIPIEVQNISQSGLLAKVKTKRKFTVDENLMMGFNNYFTDVIKTTIVRWDPDQDLLAIKFSREIKLIERIALRCNFD